MICDRLQLLESTTVPCLSVSKWTLISRWKKANQIVRQCEAVQKQQTILNHGERLAETMVSYINTDRRSRSHRPKASTAQQRPQQQRSQKCTRCEKGPHLCGACPAKEAIYHKCKKKCHYSTQCFSKGVADVTKQPTDDVDLVYLNTIGVNDHAMTFKLDTGTDVTEPSYLELKDVPLQAPTKTLHGPNQQPFKGLETGRWPCHQRGKRAPTMSTWSEIWSRIY